MKRHWFLRHFPPPKFLLMPAVGLDISDQSVKFFSAKLLGDKIIPVAYGEEKIPLGVIEGGRIRKEKELVEVLTNFRKRYKLRDAFVALPEEQAYTVRLRLPYVKPKELREAISLQLDELVPIPIESAVFDYEVYSWPKNEKGYYGLGVSVVPRDVVERYARVLESAGWRVQAMEVEAQSMARTMIPAGDRSTVLIVDIGRTRTGFAVVAHQTVLFTSTINQVSGDDLTKRLQKDLNIDHEEAEELKVKHGLSGESDSEHIFQTLLPVASVLRDEVTNLSRYWQKYDDDDRLKPRFDRIILGGGQSTLPGLVEYLNISLRVPVEISNVWGNLFSLEDYLPDLTYHQSLRYATAIGLALRNFVHLLK